MVEKSFEQTDNEKRDIDINIYNSYRNPNLSYEMRYWDQNLYDKINNINNSCSTKINYTQEDRNKKLDTINSKLCKDNYSEEHISKNLLNMSDNLNKLIVKNDKEVDQHTRFSNYQHKYINFNNDLNNKLKNESLYEIKNRIKLSKEEYNKNWVNSQFLKQKLEKLKIHNIILLIFTILIFISTGIMIYLLIKKFKKNM